MQKQLEKKEKKFHQNRLKELVLTDNVQRPTSLLRYLTRQEQVSRTRVNEGRSLHPNIELWPRAAFLKDL